MYRAIGHILATPECGRVIKPKRKVKHKELKNILFEIRGPSDSDYTKDDE